MQTEFYRLNCKLKKHHSWLYIGIETFIVGCYFVAIPNSVSGFTPFHVPIDFMDDWFPSIVWIVLGLLVIINNLFDVLPNFMWLYSYFMLFLWSFYAALMILRDLNDPRPPVIGLASIFFVIVTIRILTLMLLDDPRPPKKKSESR